jgi:hypothetical protein
MDRFLTPIVTLFVLAVTVSALLTGGGVRDFRPLEIAVSQRIENGPAIGEALRELLAIETGRTVRLAEQTGADSGDCDVILMPYSEFGEMIEKKRYPVQVGLMVTNDDDGRILPDGIVIVSRTDEADYLRSVLFRTASRVRSPGPGERARAAFARLEAAGVRQLRPEPER